MDFYIVVSFFGYILWNIFITEGSDFSDEQFDIYVNCAIYTPIPAFILAYFSGIFLLELEDGDTALFVVAVALTYMSPLFSYTLFCLCVKVKKLVTNKCKKAVNKINKDTLKRVYKMTNEEHMREAISEIKEDLKEINDILKKMQEDIKLLEDDHLIWK